MLLKQRELLGSTERAEKRDREKTAASFRKHAYTAIRIYKLLNSGVYKSKMAGLTDLGGDSFKFNLELANFCQVPAICIFRLCRPPGLNFEL